MIYLILAIIVSTSIVITFKVFPKFNIDNTQAITTNYLVAAILSFALHPAAYSFSQLPTKNWFFFACIIGFTFIITFFLFALSAQKVGVAITSVTSKMSVVIPVSIGIFLYAEPVTALKIIGIFTALLAFYLTFKKESKAKIDYRLMILPIFLFLGNGSNDSLTKHATTQLPGFGNDFMLFLGVVFTVSFIIGSVIWIISRNKTGSNGPLFLPKSIFAGAWLGLLNFGSSYFFVVALGYFDSSVFFPIFNVSIVGLSALSGFFLFKEKLRPINWFGILLAVCAIILVALGS
jgi:drug/metabolite transporter (DMT)-like permease